MYCMTIDTGDTGKNLFFLPLCVPNPIYPLLFPCLLLIRKALATSCLPDFYSRLTCYIKQDYYVNLTNLFKRLLDYCSQYCVNCRYFGLFFFLGKQNIHLGPNSWVATKGKRFLTALKNMLWNTNRFSLESYFLVRHA